MSHYSKRKSQIQMIGVMLIAWTIIVLFIYPSMKKEQSSALNTTLNKDSPTVTMVRNDQAHTMTDSSGHPDSNINIHGEAKQNH